ncbi:MAG: S8 family serine peptidase [Microlunatus sp.]|nr:S8 family serine peptidase [Microlunatus sp.]
MTVTRPRRITTGLIALLSACLLLSLAPVASADPDKVPKVPVPTVTSTPGDYVVALADAPLAAYDGDVKGYRATRPDDGERVDVRSGTAKRYRSYLRSRQNRVAARVGSTPRTRFEVGVSGFTARMTGQQAATLARTGGVVSVTPNRLRQTPKDQNSVNFLNLSGHQGVWSKLGGPGRSGRGVVVGVLDSGIWPESDSFAGDPLGERPRGRFVPYRAGGKIVMTKSDGASFAGTCQSGPEFDRSDCSTKIVGARYFGDAWLAKVPADQRDDYVSPRDGDGHGSHVGSIAVGNHGVRTEVDGRDLGRISGVAPAAKIASYKVLWEAKDAAQSGGYTSDILAAVEAAISDGVDVINFAVTGQDDPADPVQLAFLSAASAGIFVAASAGNGGPAASSVQSTSPWVTTVGAHTIAPHYGTVTLGNGRRYAGVSTSITGKVGPGPLANGSSLAAAEQNAAAAAQCAPGTLDPYRAAGAIVVCARGGVERVAKSAEVKRAGGVGMVLANPTADTLDGDLHSLPTVHVDPPASIDIAAYAATPGATAVLTRGNSTSTAIAYPQLARFSARGPSKGTGGDTLKPDLTAPGVSILGASAPAHNDGQDFTILSGTSQAAPQVAGLAALWLGAGVRPSWSPMAIKSALMTTASDLVDADGSRFTDPFGQGAGRVRPDRMLAPGLVYPAADDDWLGYLEGLGKNTGTGVKAIDPSDYNSPSIAVGRLVGTQTVTRRVTAVKRGVYRVSAKIPGVDVSVSPSKLSFRRVGQTKTFRVTFTRRTAALDQAATGFLTWQRSRSQVRIPLAVTPRELEAPALVAGSGASGKVTLRVRSGVPGAFDVQASGLATGTERTGSLAPNQNVQYAFPIASGVKASRFTARSTDAAADLNLYVYRVVDGSAVLVAQSATSAAQESVVLSTPAPGTYVALVLNAAAAPGSTQTPFTFQAASVVPGTGTGDFAVTPTTSQAVAGEPIDLTATWSGLQVSVPYVGWIEYPNGTGTVVTVN